MVAGLVVADELSRERSPLLVRSMAAAPVLPAATAEPGALPDDAHERAVTEQMVVRLQHVIARKPGRTPEENAPPSDVGRRP